MLSGERPFPNIGNKVRMSDLAIPIQYCTGGPSQHNKVRKEARGERKEGKEGRKGGRRGREREETEEREERKKVRRRGRKEGSGQTGKDWKGRNKIVCLHMIVYKENIKD